MTAKTLRLVAEPGCEPLYGNAYAAGVDLRAAESVSVDSGGTATIRTGLRIELPHGHVGLVRGRSGMAFKKGLWAFEGTIDEDYRGELSVLLWNAGDGDVRVNRGDRIAQLVVVQVVRCALEAVAELSETDRGADGFGSTGAR